MISLLNHYFDKNMRENQRTKKDMSARPCSDRCENGDMLCCLATPTIKGWWHHITTGPFRQIQAGGRSSKCELTLFRYDITTVWPYMWLSITTVWPYMWLSITTVWPYMWLSITTVWPHMWLSITTVWPYMWLSITHCLTIHVVVYHHCLTYM